MPQSTGQIAENALPPQAAGPRPSRQIWRRTLSALLLAPGGVLFGWALRNVSLDHRRVSIVAVLAIIGLSANLVGLSCTHIRLRLWLRILAIAVTLVVLVAAVALRQQCVTQTLPEVPKSDAALRGKVDLYVYILTWTAVALAYIVASLVTLPPARRTA